MVLILMGVVGAGKTTAGILVARKLGWQFADADDFHSAENKTKIAHGTALTDADRAPWLASLGDAIRKWSAAGQNVVLACSALKREYREELAHSEELKAGAVRFVYLKGDYDLIRSRLLQRHGHFATESILKSQLADLEEPNDAITVPIDKALEEIVSDILSKLSGS